MELYSMNQIFSNRILRIPDYQRGYSWQKPELTDFWEDLDRLGSDKEHYTGLITLQHAKEEEWKKWEDKWLIESQDYKPFYVVDGQQRLITSVILIQAIIESIPDGTKLNYQSSNKIKETYILYTTEDKQKKSFRFGYEKDNPSDEFLRVHIFQEHSSSNADIKTLYTKNLQEAKDFFKEELKKISPKGKESILRKLTQKLKYNLYEIDDELDVYMAFETMNNRGKKLSNLELLKNRLIYLSTYVGSESGNILRRDINNTWKTIYEYLGKNIKEPLDDDEFLDDHRIMYFKYERKKKVSDFLLKEKLAPPKNLWVKML